VEKSTWHFSGRTNRRKAWSFVLLPREHRLASCDSVGLEDIAGEAFVFPKRSPLPLGLSSTSWYSPGPPGVALLPAYARRLLPPSVVGRPLQGEAPTIDLAIAYNKINASSVLKLFLSKADELIA
jgi:LysR family hca operon transcriptional activator